MRENRRISTGAALTLRAHMSRILRVHDFLGPNRMLSGIHDAKGEVSGGDIIPSMSLPVLQVLCQSAAVIRVQPVCRLDVVPAS